MENYQISSAICIKITEHIIISTLIVKVEIVVYGYSSDSANVFHSVLSQDPLSFLFLIENC